MARQAQSGRHYDQVVSCNQADRYLLIRQIDRPHCAALLRGHWRRPAPAFTAPQQMLGEPAPFLNSPQTILASILARSAAKAGALWQI